VQARLWDKNIHVKIQTLTLKELGNYLAMCQQVRRLMIGDETYVQSF
jgi:hypothetical protein